MRCYNCGSIWEVQPTWPLSAGKYFALGGACGISLRKLLKKGGKENVVL